MSELKQTLTEALELLGCDPQRFRFDDKSTIALNFRDIGDILIDPLDDGVWFWGSLPELPAEALRRSAFDVLKALSEPVPYLASGCFCVHGAEPVWQVGGMIRRDYLAESKHLAAAIEGFYLRVLHLRELVK